jgi:hypothetical protein
VLARSSSLDLRPAAAVVDDDDLLALQGVEQPPEHLAREVGDHYDRPG